jgi:hypothetical protein
MRFLMTIGVGLAIVGCGGSAAHRTAIVDGGSSASCAGLSRAQEIKHARVVIKGIMLWGPTVWSGSSRVLVSPARVHVLRYLKGNGPSVVRIQTGASRRGTAVAVTEDGIQPKPGERWILYSSGRSQPFTTSLCGGSHRLSRS